jgi:hypothetical protein
VKKALRFMAVLAAVPDMAEFTVDSLSLVEKCGDK